MNQQPTGILLLFTDYLDNRDSIAFLRLSFSIWSSHRSPAGRYLLKPIISDEGEKFLRPSSIPSSFIDSPAAGHYFSSHCLIEDLADFSLVFPVARPVPVTRPVSVPRPLPVPWPTTVTESVTVEKSEFPSFQNSSGFSDNGKLRVFHKINQLQFSVELIENLVESGHKFPDSIQQMIFSGEFTRFQVEDFLTVIDRLPDGLTRIEISLRSINDDGRRMDFSGFSQLTEIVWNLNLPLPSLPSSLKILELGRFFNQETPESALPHSLEKLSFQNALFSRDITHSLPESLPGSLRFLQLGGKFKDPIRPGQLPSGLKTLKLSEAFNHPLELGVFPQGIETIEFSDPEGFYADFIYPFLPGLFPDSLKKLSLRFNYEYNHPILLGVLPESLESLDLTLPSMTYSHLLPPWPSGLKSLVYDENVRQPNRLLESLPHQLRSIKFGSWFNRELLPGFFPPSIEIIEFGSPYTHELVIGIFPVGVKKIRLGDYYDHPLPVGIFPEGVRMIELGPVFSPRLEVGLFPSSVKHLIISTKHPLSLGLFPDGVETIEFGHEFDEELLPGIFPSSLRSLKFTDGENPQFGQDILPGVLPEFLCELQFHHHYCGIFPSSALPPYFLSDSSISSSAVLYRLKTPNDEYGDEESPDRIVQMISRIGQNRQFLVKKLRAPISRYSSHVLIHPLDGEGEDLIVSMEFLEEIPKHHKRRKETSEEQQKGKRLKTLESLVNEE